MLGTQANPERFIVLSDSMDDDGDLIIGGYASVTVRDLSDPPNVITEQALIQALPRFMRNPLYRNVMLEHSGIQVATTIEEYTDEDGNRYITHVDPTGLYAVCSVRPASDFKLMSTVRREIRKGDLRSFSIQAEAHKEATIIRTGVGGPYREIGSIDLFELTLCARGKNPLAGFGIIEDRLTPSSIKVALGDSQIYLQMENSILTLSDTEADTKPTEVRLNPTSLSLTRKKIARLIVNALQELKIDIEARLPFTNINTLQERIITQSSSLAEQLVKATKEERLCLMSGYQTPDKTTFFSPKIMVDKQTEEILSMSEAAIQLFCNTTAHILSSGIGEGQGAETIDRVMQSWLRPRARLDAFLDKLSENLTQSGQLLDSTSTLDTNKLNQIWTN